MRRVLALGILGVIGWAAWTFRAPLGAKMREATDGELARVANAETVDASALVSTPANDDAGLAMVTSAVEISDAGGESDAGAIDASADDFDDAGEDEDEEDDDGGTLAAMRGDGSVTTTHASTPKRPRPTKPVKKRRRKR